MKTTDFDYFLPDESIAAFPAPHRDGSRLLLLGRGGGVPVHAEFANIGQYLPDRSVIVLNDTRVIPARLRGRKPTGGQLELLLTRCLEKNAADGPEMQWEALGRNLGWAPPGTVLAFDGGLTAEIRRRGDVGVVDVLLRAPEGGGTVMQLLDRVGEVPLPPYIETARKRPGGSQGDGAGGLGAGVTGGPGPEDGVAVRAFDRERYQTVFARASGAVAAPTAGLHFTENLLRSLENAGHVLLRLTLHVGLGTFRPVKTDAIEDHQMDAETYVIPEATAGAINEARRAGRPVVAVGTTVVRALESSARENGGRIAAGASSSRLFLRPGAEFQVVTDLLTNFHLPRSTLLMLVSAFAGRERVLAAYAEAVTAGYRFYSYGDAMLIRGSR